MAIAKTIQIHSSGGISNVVNYIENPDKTTVVNVDNTKTDLEQEIAYDINPSKTTLSGSDTTLVDGYRCSPDNIAVEFSYCRDDYYSKHHERAYQNKKTVDAIHLIMSFPAVEGLDPRLVHQIGIEFLEGIKDIGLGDYQGVVSTHMNTKHLHNHILINAYSIDGRQKFADCKETLKMLRELNDRLSIKYGIPIIQETDRRQSASRSETMGERSARLAGRSWKQQFRTDIESIVYYAKTYDEWAKDMRSIGYTIRELNDGTPISIADEKHHIRLSKLGSEYTFDAIIHEIAKRNHVEEKMIKPKASDIPELYVERVSRYTDSGRRRNDLEMLILRIIVYFRTMHRMIVAMGGEYSEKAVQADNKAAALEKCLELLQKYKIESISGIRDAQKSIGQQTGSLKRHLSGIYADITAVKAAMTDGELPNTYADLIPMTPLQKQDLFLALKDSGFRIYAKFDDIDLMTAATVINFLQSDRKDLVPDVLSPGYHSPAPDINTLESILQQLEFMNSETQKKIHKLDLQYKDLVFLSQNIQEAKDIDEEENERQRNRQNSHRSTRNEPDR